MQRITIHSLVILLITLTPEIIQAKIPDLLNFYLMGDVIVNKSFKTSEGKTLIFEGTGGDIRIYTSEKPEVKLKIYGDEDALEKIEFLYSENSEGIKLKIKKITSIWNFLFSRSYVDYDLIIPKKYNLNINSSGGDIFLKNLIGEVKIKTSGGDIRLENIEGSVSVTTRGGDIILREIKGNVKTITTGGDIKLEKIEGETYCTTTGGNISIQSNNGKVYATTTGGDIYIDYSGVNKGIKASTVGGDIRLILDEKIEGYFYLSTIGGDVDNQFSLTKIYSYKSSKIEGEINKPDPRIECTTTGGDIRIRKR